MRQENMLKHETWFWLVMRLINIINKMSIVQLHATAM